MKRVRLTAANDAEEAKPLTLSNIYEYYLELFPRFNCYYIGLYNTVTCLFDLSHFPQMIHQYFVPMQPVQYLVTPLTQSSEWRFNHEFRD